MIPCKIRRCKREQKSSIQRTVCTSRRCAICCTSWGGTTFWNMYGTFCSFMELHGASWSFAEFLEFLGAHRSSPEHSRNIPGASQEHPGSIPGASQELSQRILEQQGTSGNIREQQGISWNVVEHSGACWGSLDQHGTTCSNRDQRVALRSSAQHPGATRSDRGVHRSIPGATLEHTGAYAELPSIAGASRRIAEYLEASWSILEHLGASQSDSGVSQSIPEHLGESWS